MSITYLVINQLIYRLPFLKCDTLLLFFCQNLENLFSLISLYIYNKIKHELNRSTEYHEARFSQKSSQKQIIEINLKIKLKIMWLIPNIFAIQNMF